MGFMCLWPAVKLAAPFFFLVCSTQFTKKFVLWKLNLTFHGASCRRHCSRYTKFANAMHAICNRILCRICIISILCNGNHVLCIQINIFGQIYRKLLSIFFSFALFVFVVWEACQNCLKNIGFLTTHQAMATKWMQIKYFPCIFGAFRIGLNSK